MPTFRILATIATSLMLSGCGTLVPDIEASTEPNANAFLTNRIVNHIKCELREAVFRVIDYDEINARQQKDGKRRVKWLEDWAATLTIKFSANEKGSLNPGVTFIKPLPSDQSFSFGLGAVLSSEANRVETVDYLLVFYDDLIKKRHKFRNRPSHCVQPGGILIHSDLKIDDWLWSKLFPYFLPDNINESPPKTLSDDISFVRVSSGSATPTWNLIRMSTPDDSLASISRTRTDNVIITLGPYDRPKKMLSKDAQESHFAAKVGSAVAEALKNQRRN